jgi:diguanylate cyclase (GGDEF)-like protein
MRPIPKKDECCNVGAGETARLCALEDYMLVGQPPEPEFDHIVALAASLFDVPISLISIVEKEHQVFAARVGLDAESTSRDVSFCAHALDRTDPLVIEDARCDPRFAANPLVLGPPYIRFYAGAPLRVASGHVVGTICIISSEPRSFEAGRSAQLQGLAQLLVDRLELRRSERKRQIHEAHLAQLAHYDQLTGLPNRTLFHSQANALIGASAPAAVFLFDLDGFKDVNDVLGHAVGDRLLAAVGERLRADASADHLLARLGGDEFALLVPGMGDPRQAHRLATRLRNGFRRGFVVDGEELQLDTRIAMAPYHGTTPETLLMAADLALYRAKDQGGGTIGFFEPHLRHLVEARRRLQCELRQAFEAEQFELLYQPQVELATGRIVGAEALLRWKHPVHGTLSPAQFLDVLDRMPLAAGVGSWVLRTAIEQASLWNRAGTPLRVGVNLFAAQFRSGNLPERIAGKLARSGLPARLLEIELTETVAVKNSNMVAAALTALRRQGVGIALDDFGTGYASLSLLKELPVTRLKIDKGFVHDMAPGSCDAVVVDAILRMGESFGMDVIAEGVETDEQQEWLRAAGCREVQGYLHGKPMQAAELTRLIGNGHAVAVA